MIDTDKYEGHTEGPWDIIMPKMPYDKIEIVRDDVSYDQWTRPVFEWITIATLLPSQKHDAQLIADAPLLLEEVKRFRKMCLDEMVCYDCLSDLYKAGLSDENPVDAYWCGMCSEPMKGLVE
jgi:hypothetical protein